jgi:glycine/D-amino acid oxidase-like deaminating enzyme
VIAKKYDTIIIGGGFYGLRIAQFLYDELDVKKILIIEKEADVIQRASFNNQARVHSGYHYPRSILTALRSKVNFPIFSNEYKDAIVSDFIKYYVVARSFSKVTANQFFRFFERIGAEIQPKHDARGYFNRNLVEEVFLVKEFAFDSSKLKEILLNNLSQREGIQIHTKETTRSVGKNGGSIQVATDKDTYLADRVLNTTYSSINLINKASGLPIIPLKHELTEMCLVRLPENLQGKAYTIMCGPFFSIMPFPPKGAYTLSHVRFTPHSEWQDKPDFVRDSHGYLESAKPSTNFPKMIADVKRYMPDGNKISYQNESLWEVKTVLPQSEEDDSRPILYKQHHGGLQNYICIMGGKIDNIYDVFRELKLVYA